MRYLILIHRYLGIAIGLAMVMWCLSGMVMMYVSYPSLSQADRTAELPPLDLRRCCADGGADGPPSDALRSDARVTSIEVEMLGSHPVALVDLGLRREMIDLETGAPLPTVSMAEAAAVARQFLADGTARSHPDMTMLHDDQWTVSEEFDDDRPLYKASLHDGQGTVAYVSSLTGRAVQLTTRAGRAWNWLGAVPHWVYFAGLRRHAAAWTQTVILVSLLGVFLTVIGLYLGIRQYMARPGGLSPYRGLMFWHHVPGLVFGLLALTWVTSGLLSMNPWGLLQASGAGTERRLIQGNAPRYSEVTAALRQIGAQRRADSVVALRSATLHGELYFVTTDAQGRSTRVSNRGAAAPLSPSDLTHIAASIGASTGVIPQLLTRGDEFYYAHHSEPAALPVYRLIRASDGVRYYFDAVSGEILRKVDQQAREYRWLHKGLHRIDMAAWLRERPARDFVMLILLLGVTTVALTGCYAGFSRIAGRR